MLVGEPCLHPGRRLVSQLVPVTATDRGLSTEDPDRVGRSVGGPGPLASFHTPTHTVKMWQSDGAPAGPSIVERKAYHALAESWRWVATGPLPAQRSVLPRSWHHRESVHRRDPGAPLEARFWALRWICVYRGGSRL